MIMYIIFIAYHKKINYFIVYIYLKKTIDVRDRDKKKQKTERTTIHSVTSYMLRWIFLFVNLWAYSGNDSIMCLFDSIKD